MPKMLEFISLINGESAGTVLINADKICACVAHFDESHLWAGTDLWLDSGMRVRVAANYEQIEDALKALER